MNFSYKSFEGYMRRYGLILMKKNVSCMYPKSFFSSTLSKESIFTCQLKGQMIEKFRKYNRNEEFLKSSNISSKFCS